MTVSRAAEYLKSLVRTTRGDSATAGKAAGLEKSDGFCCRGLRLPENRLYVVGTRGVLLQGDNERGVSALLVAGREPEATSKAASTVVGVPLTTSLICREAAFA